MQYAKLIAYFGFKHIKGIDRRSLFKFRQFYLFYPQMADPIRDLSSNFIEYENVGAVTTLLPKNLIVGSATTQSEPDIMVPGKQILSKLSYTHIEQLLGINDPLKRTFYEIECIKGAWSVRELKRQFNSQLFERSGLSENPRKLNKLVQSKSTPQASKDIIKNIYAFEFLDLSIKEVVEESDLEKALLDHLQEFILELGHGFCFERILIGDNYYFIDLLFYHRLLKCHVLLELKLGAFEHGDIGQLNTYLNYFKDEIKEKSDNPPVGILLVAEKDHALVKYATADMDQNLFVKQYMLQLPNVEQLKNYMERELKDLRK